MNIWKYKRGLNKTAYFNILKIITLWQHTEKMIDNTSCVKNIFFFCLELNTTENWTLKERRRQNPPCNCHRCYKYNLENNTYSNKLYTVTKSKFCSYMKLVPR